MLFSRVQPEMAETGNMSEFIWNDHTIHYEDAGSGPLLMILPGNTASSAHYGDAIAYWSESYRVICPDLLGTGQSSRLASWPVNWWEENAKMAGALLDHLACPACITIGSSGGGIIALLMAILHPEKVQAVVADSTVSVWLPGQLADMVRQRQNATSPTIQFWQMGHGDDWQDVIKADGQLLLAFDRQGGNWTRERLNKIHCPVLLAGSLHDEFLPQIGQEYLKMAASIADCEIYLTNTGGHALIWSKPHIFFGIVETFLKQLH
jgi:pimeloyl-ACP methyl ester carboxylesterase